jgi:hypothetical protein
MRHFEPSSTFDQLQAIQAHVLGEPWFAKVNDIDEAFIASVLERLVVDVEVRFGHDPEGADGGQRAAVLAVQLVGATTINDQLALLAARQVDSSMACSRCHHAGCKARRRVAAP